MLQLLHIVYFVNYHIKYIKQVNKQKKETCKITLRHGRSPVNLLHIFRTPFPKNKSGGLLPYSRTNLFKHNVKQ